MVCFYKCSWIVESEHGGNPTLQIYPHRIKHLLKVTNEVLLPWEMQHSIFCLSKVEYAQRVFWKVLCKKVRGVFLDIFWQLRNKRKDPFMYLLYSWVKVPSSLMLIVFYFSAFWEGIRDSVVCVCGGGYIGSWATWVDSEHSPTTK